MSGLTRALGVDCDYCHAQGDFRAMTHRKEVANWMARELVPRLSKKSDGSAVWCSDCHAASGRGVAKILGDPRSESWAIEWMMAHLTDDLNRADGKRLRCKSCHAENLGSPGFQRKIILSSRLDALPSALPPTEPPDVEPAKDGQPDAGASSTELDGGATEAGAP